MATSDDYRPRLSIEVSEEQKLKLDKHLGHTRGLQKIVFGLIVDDLIRLLEHENGKLLLGAFVSRHASLIDMIDLPMTGDDFTGAIPEPLDISPREDPEDLS